MSAATNQELSRRVGSLEETQDAIIQWQHKYDKTTAGIKADLRWMKWLLVGVAFEGALLLFQIFSWHPPRGNPNEKRKQVHGLRNSG